MRTMMRPSFAVFAGLLLAGLPAARGQELFFVTGLSHEGSARLEAADGRQQELSLGRSVTPGTLQVADGARLMLLEESGVVAVVLGPATIAATRDDLTNGIQLDLRSGKLLFASSRGAGEGRPIIVLAQLSEQPDRAPAVMPGSPRVELELPIEPGRTLLTRNETGLAVGYLTDGTPPWITPRVNGAAIELPSGQLLTVDVAGTHQVAAMGDWLSEQGFRQAWGRELGVASAHTSRPDVEAKLFDNIIAWDRYAGATYVVSRLREQRFDIEIRQTVQTVTSANRPSQKGGKVETQPFAAANEVPLLSPAAASVQNMRDVGQGVTAQRLNSSAASLLESTGSRGLGFRGLRQLAVPGVTDAGVRTVGPAGLGAQN